MLFDSFKPKLKRFVAVARLREVHENAHAPHVADIVMAKWRTQQVLESSASSQLIRVDTCLDAIRVNCSPLVVDAYRLSDGLS